MCFELNFGLVFSSIFSIFAYNNIAGAVNFSAPGSGSGLEFSSSSGSGASSGVFPNTGNALKYEQFDLKLDVPNLKRPIWNKIED